MFLAYDLLFATNDPCFENKAAVLCNESCGALQ